LHGFNSKKILFKKPVLTFDSKTLLKSNTFSQIKNNFAKDKSGTEKSIPSLGIKIQIDLDNKLKKRIKPKNKKILNLSNINNSKHNNLLNSKKKIKYKKIDPNRKNLKSFGTINSKITKFNNSSFKISKKRLFNTNNYIINTLNVSKKKIINNGVSSAQFHPPAPQIIQDYQSQLTKLENMKKEKEQIEKVYKMHYKLINRLEDENQKIGEKIIFIQNENKKLKKKIMSYEDTQEQLITLVQIVLKSGINIENLIDQWNNEIENESIKSVKYEKDINNLNNNDTSLTDSNYELNKKIDPSSFIPINIEKPQINKRVLIGIPKLNLNVIKNKDDNNIN
jgi:hypothetical protein